MLCQILRIENMLVPRRNGLICGKLRQHRNHCAVMAAPKLKCCTPSVKILSTSSNCTVAGLQICHAPASDATQQHHNYVSSTDQRPEPCTAAVCSTLCRHTGQQNGYTSKLVREWLAAAPGDINIAERRDHGRDLICERPARVLQV